MQRRYAPDIDDPLPTPQGNGRKRGGGAEKLSIPAFMPGQLDALSSQLSTFGGTPEEWRSDLKDATAPMRFDIGRSRNFGGGGAGGGGNGSNHGGNNNGGPTIYPDIYHGFGGINRAPMQSVAPQGFLNAGQPMTQAPTSGLFAAPPSPSSAVALQRPQLQLPPEIAAMMRARRQGG